MPDTIVVTGATGHAGSTLVERLLARGLKVRAVARGADTLEPFARQVFGPGFRA